MRFIVDQNLPQLLAAWVREQKCQAEHVAELGLDHAWDGAVWRAVEDARAVLISRDRDFVRLATRSKRGALIRLRCGNCDNAVLLRTMERGWARALQALRAGDRVVEIR